MKSVISLALFQATPTGGNPVFQFIQQFGFIIVIFGIFYFLLIRPARLKQKRHQEMLNQLKNGDRVVTSGGIHGTVVGIASTTVHLRIGEKVKVEFQKSSITDKEEKK